MPIYEYSCGKCGSTKEITRGIKDPEVIPDCEKCSTYLFCGRIDIEVKMQRVIGKGTSFVLKGGGWAKDGYK